MASTVSHVMKALCSC